MARILLVVGSTENRRLLHAWLARYHSIGEHVFGEPMEAACDLCIADDMGLRNCHGEIGERRDREQPGILPVLLVSARGDVWDRSTQLWHYVDDSVTVPVSKLELQSRIEILLRARRLSMELRIRNEDLEAFIQAMSHDLRTSV